MKIKKLLICLIISAIICSCSDSRDKKREQLKFQYYNYNLNIHGGVDFSLLDDIWSDQNLRYLITPYDVGRAINEELHQDNSQFKWCKIALGREEYKKHFAERLCILSRECESTTRLKLCQIGLSSATLLDLSIGFRGLSEYSELVFLQKHEDEILKTCLDQLIEGRSICEIEIPVPCQK